MILKKTKSLSFILLLLFAIINVHAQEDKRVRQDSSFELYLLIGQSNMAGRGIITSEFANKGAPNLFMLDKENNWVPARHPLHFDKPAVAGVGPGLSFGIIMAAQHPAHKIGLIPCAVGGTSINVWKPGGFDEATKTHPYDDMLLRLQAALKTGVLKGVLWLQGESDSNPDKSAGYLQKLEILIAQIRQAAGNPSLPFVAGELGRFKEQYNTINSQLLHLPEAISFTAIAGSEGLTDKGDTTHFDAKSADEYGKRFAEKMLSLLHQ
jgi:hypothetical protein